MNWLGFLNPDVSQKVDRATEKTVEKLSEIEYKGKPVEDMTLSELAGNIKTDIKELDNVKITKEGVKFHGGSLEGEINLKKEDLMVIRLDTKNKDDVKTAEKLITNILAKKYELNEDEIKEGKVEIKIVNKDNELSVKIKNI